MRPKTALKEAVKALPKDANSVRIDALVNCDKSEFISQFREKTRGMTNKQMAELVWIFGNEQWSKGYKRGKYNPNG